MKELTPEQLDRLESALANLDHPDGVAKARLLAALTAERPPQPRLTRKVRFEVIQHKGFRFVAAAALIVAAAGTWQFAQPRSLFARTTRAMVEAKGYRCDLVEIRPEDPVKSGGRLYWSSGGEQRVEWDEGKEVSIIEIRRPGEAGLSLLPKAKQYWILPRTFGSEFPLGLFGRLSEYKGAAAKPASIGEIAGRKVEEYIVPWSQVIGDDSQAGAKMHMWLDLETSLPVRVDIVGMGTNPGNIFRLENFRWGNQERQLFAMMIPEGFARLQPLDLKAEEITEYVVLGLSTFANYAHGRYPSVKYIFGDEQGEALRKLMGVGPKAESHVRPSKDRKWNDPKEEAFAYGSYGLSWINTLQRDHPECIYYGKTVTADDAGKVLLRWKLDDGLYRVIYGNLQAESVTSERLHELETR
jgi:hypothetical protein